MFDKLYLCKIDLQYCRNISMIYNEEEKPDLAANGEHGITIHNHKTASGDKSTSFNFQFTLCHVSSPLIGQIRLSCASLHMSPNRRPVKADRARVCAPVLPLGDSGGILQFYPRL